MSVSARPWRHCNRGLRGVEAEGEIVEGDCRYVPSKIRRVSVRVGERVEVGDQQRLGTSSLEREA